MAPSPPLDIAVVIHRVFPHGGLQRDALATAVACAAAGHRVTLVTQRVEGEIPAGIELDLRPVRGSSNHARALAFGGALQRYRREAAPDVVIGFDKLPGLDLYFAGDRCYVERVHATRSFLSRLTRRYRTFRGLEESVFRKGSGTGILLLRAAQKEAFQEWYGTEDARFEVLPPGVDPGHIRPADADARRRAMRERLGIPTSDPVMLFVGSDYARKGLDRAVDALRSLRAGPSPRARLIAVGADDPASYIQRAGTGPGTGAAKDESGFLALGARDDVSDLMLCADLLVHPARTEAGGVVLLEAIASGTPVIASSVCGYGHIVEDAEAGILLPEPASENGHAQDLSDAAAAPLSPGGKAQLHRWREGALRYTADHPELFQMHAHIVRAIERAGEAKAGPL